MLTCPRCGHQNLPSFPTCSKCGTSLAGDAPPAFTARPGRAPDPGKARGRAISAVILLLAAGAMLLVWSRDKSAKAARQAKLDFFDKWATVEKDDVGAFWNCVMLAKTDVGLFSNGAQVQRLMETAYATQPQSYGEHLTGECARKLERAQKAMADLDGAPAELAGPLAAYKATLPKLGRGLEDYAGKLSGRKAGKDVDALIQEYGDKWHAEDKPTPQTIAFERFLHCAVPGLAKMKDAQAMLEFLADACFKKDAAAFMDRVHTSCGKLLEEPSSAPSKTWNLSKRFYEQEARQMQAWDSCSRRARKGRAKSNEELASFIPAFAEYLAARNGMKTATVEATR